MALGTLSPSFLAAMNGRMYLALQNIGTFEPPHFAMLPRFNEYSMIPNFIVDSPMSEPKDTPLWDTRTVNV